MKFDYVLRLLDTGIRRSPRGERGLKFIVIAVVKVVKNRSLSSRRAWIEILRSPSRCGAERVALLAESVD